MVPSTTGRLLADWNLTTWKGNRTLTLFSLDRDNARAIGVAAGAHAGQFGKGIAAAVLDAQQRGEGRARSTTRP